MMCQLKSRTTRRCRHVGAALLLLMSVGATVGAEVPTFDGRGWTVGHQQQNGVQSIIEYVLPGQTVENYKEMVTSQVFSQPVPVARLVEKLHASLAQGCPSLVWTVIQQDEKTVIYEWRDSGCGGFEPTSELARVTIEGDSLYRLAYAVKGPLSAERRKEWLAILGQAPLAEKTDGRPAEATRGAPEPSRQTGRLAKWSTEELAAGLRRSGLPCPSGSRSQLTDQIQGPAGPLTEWRLECSNGVRYTVFVDPFGAMTAFQTPGK
jgi:hypothetical protein